MYHYICNRCGCLFDEDHAEYDVVRQDFGATETYMVCPCCGDDDFETAVYCERCGEPKRNGELRGGYYCAECFEEMSTPYHEHQYIKENADDYAEWLHERWTRRAKQQK